MARAKTTKLYRTFTKGLITEAGYLTYPENASIDELNTVIKPKGSRSRRFGLDYEPDSTTTTLTGLTDGTVLSEFEWRGAANDADFNFLVMQIKTTLVFYDMAVEPITAGKKSFTVNLSTYKAPLATTAKVQSEPVQMASGKGFLFVTNEYIEPIVIEYDPDTGTISVLKLLIAIRDFEGVYDGLSNEDQPSTLSAEHYYNLRNQGWVAPGQSELGAEPPGGGGGSTPTVPDPTEGGGSYPDFNTGDVENIRTQLP